MRAWPSAASAATALCMNARIAACCRRRCRRGPSSPAASSVEIIDERARDLVRRRAPTTMLQRRPCRAAGGAGGAAPSASCARSRDRDSWRARPPAPAARAHARRSAPSRRHAARARARAPPRTAPSRAISGSSMSLGSFVVRLDMIEERRDRGIRLVAVDQRHAERRIRMGPAGERRHHAVAPLDARRKQPDQPRGAACDHTSTAPASAPNTGAAASAKAGS